MAYRETSIYNPDNLLIATTCQVISDDVIVAANQTLKRGQVFELDASGNAIAPTGVIDPAKVYGIMAEDIVTGDTTAVGVAYMNGEFSSSKVIFPEGKSEADYKVPLRKLGIFLR
ncbi:head decoration protein [Clostridium cylindrosporum]|uniref:Head decoration protein n=1 Tax=Clostridium cylindrosporum DSM 605 TaxID=1121307 RepID=A0A0J8G5X1_CLOCY|nr:head decoration protein [Clostridium cylindrosporum]KMT23001.1 hypothetical protein CLCY_7c00480 [Clostridium cylindrosporum DSM 605]